MNRQVVRLDMTYSGFGYSDAQRRWFEVHGMDPMGAHRFVPIPSDLILDFEHRTITYTYLVIDERGYPVIDPDDPWSLPTEKCVIQLESGPMPYPDWVAT